MSHSWPLRASLCTPSRALFSIMHPVRVQAGGISYAQEWVPYQHEDGHDSHRWTPKECFQYLEDRPWDEVLKFYSLVAAGKFSLSDLTLSRKSQYAGLQKTVSANDPLLSVLRVPVDARKEPKGGRWDRKNYKIVLSYDGSVFSGWQKQPGLFTVQGVLEKALGSFSSGNMVASLKVEGLCADATIAVAGRTDKGVHAAGQVCSFYTWRSDLTTEDIKSLINSLEPKALRAISVEEVSRTFHPTFSAQWRRYVYILPLHNVEEKRQCLFQQNDTNFGRNGTGESFDVMVVNEMLSQLEGQQLSFTVFARDTKASRSRGPPTECYIHHARAAIAELPLMEQDSKKRREVMCVELVANRFLRKMVRVLVATSVREAAAGAPSNMLVRLTGASCRRASAPPAPACGLCLTEVSYGNFSAASLLINRIL